MIPSAFDVQNLTKQKVVYTFDRRKVWSQLKLLPNIISLSRLLIIIPICLLYASPRADLYRMAVVLMILAYISDFIDGMVARRWRMITPLGLVLDPLADKVWTITMTVLLLLYRDFPLWLGGIVIGRDLAIGLVNTPIFRRLGLVFPADVMGKVYMVIVGLVILGYTLYIPQTQYLAYLIPLLALFTLIRYAYRAVKVLRTFASLQSRGTR